MEMFVFLFPMKNYVGLECKIVNIWVLKFININRNCNTD